MKDGFKNFIYEVAERIHFGTVSIDEIDGEVYLVIKPLPSNKHQVDTVVGSSFILPYYQAYLRCGKKAYLQEKCVYHIHKNIK